MKDLGIRVWGLGRRGSSREPMEVRIGNVRLLVRAPFGLRMLSASSQGPD